MAASLMEETLNNLVKGKGNVGVVRSSLTLLCIPTVFLSSKWSWRELIFSCLTWPPNKKKFQDLLKKVEIMRYFCSLKQIMLTLLVLKASLMLSKQLTETVTLSLMSQRTISRQ